MNSKEILKRLEEEYEIQKLNLILERQKKIEAEKERMKVFIELLFSKETSNAKKN